ncbi:hypothetical protein, partial [Bradyrhizobium viridifuturi]|uniref:hypothetical protein n=1 Tax=Bradyrhizobium viridifuturi TaxID=1654716 RepID=UPI001AEBD479
LQIISSQRSSNKPCYAEDSLIAAACLAAAPGKLDTIDLLCENPTQTSTECSHCFTACGICCNVIGERSSVRRDGSVEPGI